MTDRTSKRSSDANVFVDTKKKKIGKEKQVDVSTEKISTVVGNEVLRQKKAFCAYFGKSYDNGKNGKNSSNGGVTDSKKAQVTNRATSNITGTGNCVNRSQTPVEIIELIDTHPQFPNHCFLKKNESLTYVSSFVEESGCFPKITHVNRLADSSFSELVLHLNEEILYNSIIKNSKLSSQMLNPVSKQLVLESYKMEMNLSDMISYLKKSVPHFPVLNFHKHMRKKYLLAEKSATDIESLWIDKYKPMCREEMLGNNELVKKLKDWLEPKKQNSKLSKTSQHYYDDDDYIFNTDSDSSLKTQHNLAILLGPSGCGKTSAVYAVANELNANVIKVIELNASCNRNGKRIISDLMEATQSHAVEKNCLLNLMKGKKKKPTNSKKKDVNEKMTIILIEDADIFFDNYDDGFLPALSTLANDSKRPLVLIANDPFSNHLMKFFSSNEIILNFIHPSKEYLSCFLQLIALNEEVNLSKNELSTFIHPFKPDIRQSMLQLQYVLSTGKTDKKTVNNSYKRNINSIWWNWPYLIGHDLTKIEENPYSRNHTLIIPICQSLDNLSKLNSIYSKTQDCDFLNPQPFWYHLATRDSASLIETHHWTDNSVQLSADITQWIHDHIYIEPNVTEKLYPNSEELSQRQRIWNTSKDILEQIGLDYCNRKNETAFDYLATIRSINRYQQTNQPYSHLRYSKMFSYLDRIDINIDCNTLNHFCDSLFSSSSVAEREEAFRYY